MVRNFLHGGAAVNALCRASGMDLRIVDAGCAGGPFEPHDMLVDMRLGEGTGAAVAYPCCVAPLQFLTIWRQCGRPACRTGSEGE
jgi:NaMN:DMB phosphoribosyltransferase